MAIPLGNKEGACEVKLPLLGECLVLNITKLNITKFNVWLLMGCVGFPNIPWQRVSGRTYFFPQKQSQNQSALLCPRECPRFQGLWDISVWSQIIWRLRWVLRGTTCHHVLPGPIKLPNFQDSLTFVMSITHYICPTCLPGALSSAYEMVPDSTAGSCPSSWILSPFATAGVLLHPVTAARLNCEVY